jgi:YggT family protein
MQLIGLIIYWVLTLYEWILIARIILSWVEAVNRNWSPRGAMLVVCEAIYTLTDPPVKFFRKFIKPIRLGNVAIDISVMAVLVVLMILSRINFAIFF